MDTLHMDMCYDMHIFHLSIHPKIVAKIRDNSRKIKAFYIILYFCAYIGDEKMSGFEFFAILWNLGYAVGDALRIYAGMW